MKFRQRKQRMEEVLEKAISEKDMTTIEEIISKDAFFNNSMVRTFVSLIKETNSSYFEHLIPTLASDDRIKKKDLLFLYQVYPCSTISLCILCNHGKGARSLVLSDKIDGKHYD